MPTRLNSSENPDPAIAADFLEEEHPTSSNQEEHPTSNGHEEHPTSYGHEEHLTSYGHEEHLTSYGQEEHHDRKRRDVQSDPPTEVKKITR